MHASSVILLTFVTSVLTAAGTTYFVQRYNVLPPAEQAQIQVPQLAGLLEEDARANAVALGLALLVAAREPSTEAPRGTVLRQSIPPGQRVPQDHPVSVVVAEEMPRVPALSGLSVPEATEKVRKSGYVLEVGTPVADDKIPAGSVASQSPVAEAVHVKGGAVIVHTSSGPAAVVAPKLIGLGRAEAEAKAQELGLKATIRWLSLPETVSQVVLRQEPAAGKTLKPGSEVEITINR
jgi:eukaryotic-like serine/threonine-protein kinase